VVDALGDRAGLVDVTQAQLAQLTQADVLASVSGGKSVVFDGGPSNFDTSVLPGDLRAPAEAFSEANRIGVERCPSVASDITASKARMYSAIRANLVDPAFMASFFSDPRSPGLFDTSLVLLMAQMARPYFEVLLTGHWDWFVELLEGSAATRSAITHDYPDDMLRALAEAPSIGPTLARDEWRADLQVGIDGASPVARSGMQQLFGPQLAALGLDAS
jgi:hypothetical protein